MRHMMPFWSSARFVIFVVRALRFIFILLLPYGQNGGSESCCQTLFFSLFTVHHTTTGLTAVESIFFGLTSSTLNVRNDNNNYTDSRVHRVPQLRIDGVNCRESTGKGPVMLKVVRVMGAAFSAFTMDQLLCVYIFPYPLYWFVVCMAITHIKGKDQPGKVANPAHGYLNRENVFFPVPVRA